MGKMIRKMGFPQHVQQVMFFGKRRVWTLREKGHIKCVVLYTGSTLKAQGLGCSGSKLLGVYKFDLYYPCEKLGVVTFVYNRSTGGGEPDPQSLLVLLGWTGKIQAEREPLPFKSKVQDNR